MANVDNDYAIKIEGVKKQYRLGQIGGGTLTADLQSWWARVRGKEDPNMRIDQDQRLIGQTFMALNGIDLTIKQGEAIGIIGHNGAGKSTLLKLLSRVTAPTAGTIDINGRIASMLEVGTGFHGEMTGRENVYLNGAILGMTRAEIDAKMDEIIEFSEIGDFIDTPVKRYSSGMYVKLAFSVAAHLDSEIMIMDEVLAVGDMAFQKKCLTKMREAAKQDGRTVLYVSHNMNTIRQLCDRCVVLDQGKLIFDGNVEDAISLYIGTNNNGFNTFYDFRDVKRNFGFGKDVFINELAILDKKEPVFANNETIKFRVILSSKIDLNSANVVIQVKTRYYEKIGMALSKPFKIKKDENKTIDFEMRTDSLSSDVYCLGVEIVSIDKYNNFVSYDNPAAKIPIDINNDLTSKIVWHKEFWGNIMFDEIDILG